MFGIPVEALAAGNAIVFAALLLFLAIIFFRIPSPRELKDKDAQIEYFKQALAKSEEQKAALMITAESWKKTFDTFEILARKAMEEDSSWLRRARAKDSR